MECPFKLALEKQQNGDDKGGGNDDTNVPPEKSPSSPLPSSPDSGSQTPAASMTSFMSEGYEPGPGKRKLDLRSLSEGVAALCFPSVSSSGD